MVSTRVSILIIVFLAYGHEIRSDTSSDITQQCPRKCDMIKELDVIKDEMRSLRQMLTQESLLRMNLELNIQSQINRATEDTGKRIQTINQTLLDEIEENTIEADFFKKDVLVMNQTIMHKTTEVISQLTEGQKNLKALNDSLKEIREELYQNVSDHSQTIQALHFNVSTMSLSYDRTFQKLNNGLQNESRYRIKGENDVETRLQEVLQMVTKLNQSSRILVAFSASPLMGKEYEGGEKILMDKVLTNVEGHYRANESVFICGDDGVYFFSWNVVKWTGSGFSVHMMVNGVSKSSCYSNKSGYDLLSGSVVLTLNRQDRVWLKSGHYRCSVHQYPYSTFSGIRL